MFAATILSCRRQIKVLNTSTGVHQYISVEQEAGSAVVQGDELHVSFPSGRLVIYDITSGCKKSEW